MTHPDSHFSSFLRCHAPLALWICAWLCGCKVYPEPEPRTLTELYYEAIAASQNLPDRNGAADIRNSSSIPRAPVAEGSGFRNRAVYPRGTLAPVPSGGHLPPVEQQGSDEQFDSPPIPPEVDGIPLLPVEAVSHPHDSTKGWQRAGRIRTAGTTAAGDSTGNRITPVSAVHEAPVLITEFFEDTDIRQALQSLATQAEVTVIVDGQVGGVVNAVIEDEPFDVALRKVLLPSGLVHRKTEDGDYLVGVPDPASSLFSQLSEQIEFRPLHLSPEELGGMLGDRDARFIRVLETRNRILIEAPTEIAESIHHRLQKFDTPIPQVELEAIVCVVSPDNGFQSGLDWGHAVTVNGSELLNIGLAGLALTGNAAGQGVSNAFSDFAVTSAFVRLLAQEGYLSIRAAPRVTARDGDQAKISITRESFFSTQPQSDNAFFRQEIETVEAGIQLDITPIIRGDNITVKIEKAEVSEDIRTAQINTSITENPFPQINRRTVSTTVHVRDGETIVIGGLVQRQKVDRIAKIPVLGDIPGIGRAFQTIEQTEQDAEVVIFISPRLVKPTGCCDPPPNIEG